MQMSIVKSELLTLEYHLFLIVVFLFSIFHHTWYNFLDLHFYHL